MNVRRKAMSFGCLALGAMMVVACADHKGFKSRINTPEENLRLNIRNGKIGAKQSVEMGLDQDLGGPTTARVPVPVLDSDKDQPQASETLNQIDKAAMDEFSAVVTKQFQKAAESSVSTQLDEGASGKKDEGEKKDGGEARTAPTEAELKNLAKLEEIRKALADGSGIARLIRGLDVVLRDISAKGAKVEEGRFELNVDLLLALSQDALVSGKAFLTSQDQLTASRIVEVQLKAIDSQAREIQLQGVEAYAACMNEECKEIQLMILMTREDEAKTKVAFVGQFTFDGQGVGTNLGDRLRSVKEGQDEVAKERAAADEARLKAEDEAKREGASKAGEQAEQKAKGEESAKTGTKADVKSDAKVEKKAEAKPEAKVEKKADAKTEVKVEKKVDSKPEAKVENTGNAKSGAPAATVSGSAAGSSASAQKKLVGEEAKLDQVMRSRSQSADALIKEIKFTLSPRNQALVLIHGVKSFNLALDVTYNILVTRGIFKKTNENVTLTRRVVVTDVKVLSNKQYTLIAKNGAPDMKSIEILGACVEKGCEKFQLMFLFTKHDGTKMSSVRQYSTSATGMTAQLN